MVTKIEEFFIEWALLKVRKSRKQFMGSSILPKNEQKITILSIFSLKNTQSRDTIICFWFQNPYLLKFRYQNISYLLWVHHHADTSLNMIQMSEKQWQNRLKTWFLIKQIKNSSKIWRKIKILNAGRVTARGPNSKVFEVG